MNILIKNSNKEIMPLVTFVLLAYNQEQYIREAVQGAFAQDYEHLEIILSDDCSTDKTFEIMKEMAARYDGLHKIILNKNESNLNIGGHINKIMEISSGELVVVAAGDDISRSLRTSDLVNAWVMDGKSKDLLCSDYIAIDNNGHRIGYGRGCKIHNMVLREMAKHGHGVVGATAAWTKRLWTEFGKIPSNVVIEDVIMPLRAVLSRGLLYVEAPLVMYRQNTSTWVEREETIDPFEIQKRTKLLILYTINSTIAQFNDAKKINKHEILYLITLRLNTYAILIAIYEKRKTFLECVNLLKFAKYNRVSVIKAIIKVYFPICHKFFLYIKNIN